MRSSNQHENKRFVVEIVFSYSDISFFILGTNTTIWCSAPATHANTYIASLQSTKKTQFVSIFLLAQLKHTRKLT